MDTKKQSLSQQDHLNQLYTQAADRRVRLLETQLRYAEQRAVLLEQRLNQLLEICPISLPAISSFDESAYVALNSESLQHSTLKPVKHFKAAAPMSVRWMQTSQLDTASQAPVLLVVCELDEADQAAQQALYDLLCLWQKHYYIVIMQMGPAVLAWAEFDRVYVYSVRDHYGELQFTIQYLQQRYARLCHAVVVGAGAKNAYWSLALAGVARTALWWQQADMAVSQGALQEMFFWANGGLALPHTQAYLATLFSAHGLRKWQFKAWRDLTLSDWVTLFEAHRRQYQQEKHAQQQIRAARVFISSFFAPDFQESVDQAVYIEQYLRRWHTGIEPRKPCPGFHPAIYAEQNQLDPEQEPLSHYLQHGRPAGAWHTRRIGNAAVWVAPDAPVALHIHAYYIDMLAPILRRIDGNRVRPDLFISVQSAADARIALSLLEAYPSSVHVRVVPNRGRDIGPFLTEFGAELVKNYRYIGHVHTKQSLHVQERDAVTAWQNFLLEAVLGGEQSGAMLDACVSHMVLHADCCMVYPDDPKIIGWDHNRELAQLLADKMRLGSLPTAFNFPAGTMFWVRAETLARFVGLGLAWEDYPLEPVGKDGTILHALERLFGAVPLLCNQPYAVAWALGFSR